MSGHSWSFMSCGFKADPVYMIRGDGEAIAVVHKGDRGDKPREQQRREAALIAAVPDLLAALEAIDALPAENAGKAWNIAHAAVAKVKGGVE